MLIVLRGNSGSGKSTTAKLLRETAIKNGSKRRVALVEQDYIRRIILKEQETEGADNIELIFRTVSFALDRGYAVILEGILYSERYREMLENLCKTSADNYFYYFDVPLEETLKRHQSKPNAHEFGEKEIREWYKEKDLLGLKNEQIINQNLNLNQIIEKILTDCGL